MNRIARFIVLLLSVAMPLYAGGSQTLLSSPSGQSAWVGFSGTYPKAPPGWKATAPSQMSCDGQGADPKDVHHCRNGIAMLYPYVDQNGKQHTLALHVGGERGWPRVIIDGVPEQWTDVTPPALASSDAVLINGPDYVDRQINCDGDRVFVDGKWRADGTTEIPSLGGPLIVHCGLPGAPRYGPPDVYLSGRSPHRTGGVAPATERAMTTSQDGHQASAGALWYIIHPGGLAGLGHWAACGGVIFVARDTPPSLAAGMRWQEWTAEGPFNDKQTCEGLTRSDRRGGAVCVPEDDSRVDPEIRAIAHFPSDAATGRIIFPPEFQSQYPTPLLTPAEADQPCPKGSIAPWGLVRAKAEMEQARAAAAKSMDQPPAPSR